MKRGSHHPNGQRYHDWPRSHKTGMSRLKLGETVAVCYDGKLSRRMMGVVTGFRQCSQVRVKFTTWAIPQTEVEVWFRVSRSPYTRLKVGGFVKLAELGVHELAFGLPGTWYSVYAPRNFPVEYRTWPNELGAEPSEPQQVVAALQAAL